MNTEERDCLSCKRAFCIEPEDFDFYEKLKVPPPTRCADCRQQRRYAWRNERVFYRRNCDLCDKSTVTIYSPNKPFKVYCPPCFWSDRWDPLEYGRDFDFSKPFFPQFHELQKAVPRIALLNKNSVDSEYTNHSDNNKNCYLSTSIVNSENIFYSTNTYGTARDCMDCYHVEVTNELLYQSVDMWRSYNCQYGYSLQDCRDCYYSFDLRGCSDCFLSSNLRNKQYCFLNTQYTKEEYKRKLTDLDLGSHKVREELYKQWRELMQDTSLHKAYFIERSTDTTGNLIYNSKNSQHVFDASEVEDSKYGIVYIDAKTGMDLYHVGFRCELLYEGQALIYVYNSQFCLLCYHDRDIQYCDNCHNSENLFGCVGMKKGSYAIFNKQYPKEEYEVLRDKLIAHMKTTGEYGEYFPAENSHWGYNETQGQVYMPLEREEVLRRGWRWEDQVPGTFGKGTLDMSALPDHIDGIDDGILKEVLTCVTCSKNYNVVGYELQFYRRGHLPVPRQCFECRYRSRIALRPPRALWHRQCMCDHSLRANTVTHAHHLSGRCPNEFETPYAPERKETVYCEQCYQAEIT